ncbi:MAG: hypothetical protein NE328_07840 [Lentisphaeraceae bacterium]|nr:hypothetical protein [Lentisphaeraceae bacterium]
MKNTLHISLFVLLIATLNVSAEKLLIFRQGSANFEELVKSVKGEIGEDLDIVDHILSEKATYKEFVEKTRAEKPDLLLLLDNKAVNFAKKFNKEKDEYAQNLKGVAAMGLNLRKELKGNKNICAVEYEVPAYTIITGFKYIVKKDIKNVLVFYRKSEQQDVIDSAAELLSKEGITLNAMNTEDYGTEDKDVKFFLQRNVMREMYHKGNDLVWVLSDSVMLDNDNFAEVWVNAARKNKMPFIAGIKSFAAPDMQFCTYAASPNHKDLGSQVTEMIFAIIDGSTPEEIGVEYILSVEKSANLEKIKDNNIETNPDRMADVKVSE